MPGKEQLKPIPAGKEGNGLRALKEDVRNNMGFQMRMGSKSATNSDSAFAMKDESNMYMSALFHPADPPGHFHPNTELHSYTQTNTNTKRSGGGGESSNVEKKSTSNLSDYKSTLVDLGPDFKPTKEQTDAANAKVAELKKLDAKNTEFNKNISNSNESSIETSVDKNKVVLGENTQAEILKEGEEYKQNRRSRIQAERGAGMDESQRDSIRVASEYLDKKSKIKPLTQYDVDQASMYGDRAGANYLMNLKGSEGEQLFSKKEARDLYSADVTFNRPPIKNFNKFSNKKKKKLGYRVRTGYTSTGLGSTPQLSDLQMNIGDKALKFYNRDK